MKTSTCALILGCVAVGVASVIFIQKSSMNPDSQPVAPRTSASFEECVAMGNPVMESYPRQCRDEAGVLFVEEIDIEEEPSRPVIGAGEYEDRIRVTFPVPGSVIQSPLEIRGEARGMWYFEAAFPITLVDWDGRIIAETYATADGEWMTEEYVPFTSTLTFKKPYTDSASTPDYMKWGTLILKRDNPSGLPEKDAAIEIPIRFDNR